MSKIILPQLPGNLGGLQGEEGRINIESILAANADQTMTSHVNLILASLNALMWSHNRSQGKQGESETALSGLNVRLFNSTAASLKLLLSGYYSVAVASMRDILEVVFLLDFLESNRNEIAEWISKPDQRKFRPVAIREWLDSRDGKNGKERARLYKLLCNYGAHATYEGMMLLNAGNNLMSIGPFYNEKFLSHLLPDLARHLPYAILTRWKFETADCVEDFQHKSAFLSESSKWWKTHSQPEFDDAEIVEIGLIVDALGRTFSRT